MLPISPPTWQAPSRPVSAARQGNYPEAEVFPWRRRWAISWSSGCAPGASSACSAIPGTASTGSWLGSSTPATSARASSRRATRSWPRSWRERTQNLPGSRECASPPPGRGPSTCSTGCMTRAWITSRWSRSWVNPPPPRSAATISRRSICRRCSRTWHTISSPPLPPLPRCGMPSTARSASRSPRSASLFGVLAAGRAGARRPDRSEGAHARNPLSDGGQSPRRRGGDVARAAPVFEAQGEPELAAGSRGQHARVEKDPGGARGRRGEAAQPRRRLPRAEQAAPGAGDLHRRLRKHGNLVRALSRLPRRNDGLALGQPGDDGTGDAVCRGGEARLSRSAGLRAGRGRGDADERQQREIPDFPYASYAESVGFMGLRVDRPEDVGRTWDVALAADRPVLVEAVVDPEFPMIPPHVTLQEATADEKSVLKGDPDAKHMIGETIKTAVAGVFKKDGERGE